jgi:hypothetical protein
MTLSDVAPAIALSREMVRFRLVFSAALPATAAKLRELPQLCAFHTCPPE